MLSSTEFLLAVKLFGNAVGIDNKLIWKLIKHYGSVDNLIKADLSKFKSYPKITPEQLDFIANTPTDMAQEELALADQTLTRIVSIEHPDYPPLLKLLDNPPLILYMRGNVNWQNKSIAILGMRKCTKYGIFYANYFSQQLAQRGFTIVGGLTAGIEYTAHQAALKAHGHTIVILPAGLEQFYDRNSIELTQKILSNGGALISEYPLRSRKDSYSFGRRNYTLAGLCHAGLVVEAKKDSGSLHTAKYLALMDRDLFAIPGNISENSCSSGCNYLIANGAYLVQSVQDIIRIVGGSRC